jgi:hypothetical protein
MGYPIMPMDQQMPQMIPVSSPSVAESNGANKNMMMMGYPGYPMMMGFYPVPLQM